MSIQLPILGKPMSGPMSRRPLRVGELAKTTGKTVRALHLYEERGLLEPVERTKGNYRLYHADSVTRVRWITQLQEIGLSLPEIRDLLDEFTRSESAPIAMHKVEDLYKRKLDETKDQIAKLQQLQTELEASLRYLETCETSCESQVELHECPSCERHSQGDTAPVLVAGFHAS